MSCKLIINVEKDFNLERYFVADCNGIEVDKNTLAYISYQNPERLKYVSIAIEKLNQNSKCIIDVNNHRKADMASFNKAIDSALYRNNITQSDMDQQLRSYTKFWSSDDDKCHLLTIKWVECLDYIKEAFKTAAANMSMNKWDTLSLLNSLNMKQSRSQELKEECGDQNSINELKTHAQAMLDILDYDSIDLNP